MAIADISQYLPVSSGINQFEATTGIGNPYSAPLGSFDAAQPTPQGGWLGPITPYQPSTTQSQSPTGSNLLDGLGSFFGSLTMAPFGNMTAAPTNSAVQQSANTVDSITSWLGDRSITVIVGLILIAAALYMLAQPQIEAVVSRAGVLAAA